MRRLFIPCSGPLATITLILLVWFARDLDGHPYIQTALTAIVLGFNALDSWLARRWWKIRRRSQTPSADHRDQFNLRHYLKDINEACRTHITSQEAVDAWERVEERLQ